MTLSGPDAGIFIVDANMVVRTWSPWLAGVTGVPADAARGKALNSLFPDLATRGHLARLRRVVTEGAVEVLAPTLHHYLLRCPPARPSRYFEEMQQRVTMAPLRDGNVIIGAIVTIEDVTERLERERDRAASDAGPGPVRTGSASETGAGPTVAVDALSGALSDADWQVRRAAAGELAQYGGPTVLGNLLRMLREEYQDIGVLNSALQALAIVGGDAVEPLGALLHDPDEQLRMYATLALGTHRDRRAIPFLLEALADSDANVRYHAVEALGRLRAAETVEPLLALAQAGDFFLAFPALDALANIGDPRAAPGIVPLLSDELLRGPAVDALGKLGDAETVAPLAELLNRPGGPGLTVAQGLAALYERYERLYQEGAYVADVARCKIDEAGVANLLAALETANPEDMRALVLVLGWLQGPAIEQALARLLGQPEVRREVVEALVRHGPRVTELLLGQLRAEDPAVRQAAIVALGRIGDARAVPELVRVLTSEPDLMVIAAGALARIGDPRPFEALLGMLGHPDASVRQAVVSALNSLGHPDMAGRIVPLLSSPDPYVRESAVKIAGYFGYPECVPGLLAACHDPEENVRRAAIEHLPYLDDPRSLDALAEGLAVDQPRVRAAAARALVQVRTAAAVPLLVRALADKDAWVRYAAARSLGHHGAPETLSALAAVAREDPAPQARIAALEALGETGGAQAVAILAPFIEAADIDIALAALRALGHIAHPDALPPLLAALRSTQPARRAEAARAVGQRGSSAAVAELQWVAAGDLDPVVTAAAIEALGRLRTPEAVTALLALATDPTRREACVLALAAGGQAQAGEVARGLDSPQPAVRRAAIDALAQMKSPHASALLIAGLEHPDPDVRVAVCAALGRLGSRQAERRLATLAHDDPDPAVRRAAELALSRCS